ncbi:MAG: response regulator transcription factor [Methylophilaceae bacterium]
METKKKVSIAFLDDDFTYAEQILEWLNLADYEVTHFSTGMDFLKNFSDAKYDLCIFDFGLPDIHGADVMDSIKLKSNKLPPIIFLTGMNVDEKDMVRLIDSGADDYIIKPISRPLLIARINALLRRSLTALNTQSVSEFGALTVNSKLRKIHLDGQEIKVTDKEFDLAIYFLRNEGALLSRAHLMQVVWGSSAEVETRKVDVHVSHLRTKLKLVPEYGWKLSSIYQQGYRLERSQ